MSMFCGPEIAGLLLLGAVDVGAVEPVGQRVDLLHGAGTAVEPGGAVGPHKVHAGLPEEGVVLRDPDGEALGLRAGGAGVQKAAPAVATVAVDRRGVTHVVVDELAERHHEHRKAAPRNVRVAGE